MLEKGKLVPDVEFTTFDGARRKIWEWRQKSHVLLLIGAPEAVSAAA